MLCYVYKAFSEYCYAEYTLYKGCPQICSREYPQILDINLNLEQYDILHSISKTHSLGEAESKHVFTQLVRFSI